MKRVQQDINEVWRASEVLENLALVEKEDVRSAFTLEESRQMRDKLLDTQLKLARAERYLLQVPVLRTL
jgi:hypothetical protein